VQLHIVLRDFETNLESADKPFQDIVYAPADHRIEGACHA
jgi:hypothetical protein